MTAQLQEQLKSEAKARAIVNEIESGQLFNHLFAFKQKPTNVGEYFKKHKEKCLRKFTNS